jgi:hypothetical protein
MGGSPLDAAAPASRPLHPATASAAIQPPPGATTATIATTTGSRRTSATMRSGNGAIPAPGAWIAFSPVLQLAAGGGSHPRASRVRGRAQARGAAAY